MSRGVGELTGLRVVVTRPREQAASFVAELKRRGAEVIVAPTIRVVGPPDRKPLLDAARRAAEFDWIVLTSTNGVRFFWAALRDAGMDPASLAGVRFACVGPATAAALAEYGVEADVVPETYVGEAVVEAIVRAHGGAAVEGSGPKDGALGGEASVGRNRDVSSVAPGDPPLAGIRFLLPLAAGARPVIAQGLTALGAEVERVEAYRSVPEDGDAADLKRRLVGGGVDVITFTSSSAVDSFVASVGTELGGAVVAVIGPLTERTARGYGLPVEAVAEEHTIAGLLEALAHRFGPNRDHPTGV